MKAYKVGLLYNMGHESGYYESPLFATRELAEEFARKVKFRQGSVPYQEYIRMWDGGDGIDPQVSEVDVDVLTELPDIKEAIAYLNITYT